MPFSAATSKLSVCVHARYIRGCGFWNGFGSTWRGGTFQNFPSQENSSDCQIFGSMVIDSSHIARVSRGSIPCPICSYAFERPVPSSIRPSVSWSSIATRSATRTGWWYGRMHTPKPSRMRLTSACSARRAAPPGTASPRTR